ncbi:unnamed protein product [Lactuca saligna]|uniref:Uncharacterized protein n=1 Tax=Lactuca saligna TaxID=75948 RepID=A0AA35VR23_LACSI|nr:unnamed protein product [Lactuca saligna]
MASAAVASGEKLKSTKVFNSFCVLLRFTLQEMIVASENAPLKNQVELEFEIPFHSVFGRRSLKNDSSEQIYVFSGMLANFRKITLSTKSFQDLVILGLSTDNIRNLLILEDGDEWSPLSISVDSDSESESDDDFNIMADWIFMEDEINNLEENGVNISDREKSDQFLQISVLE